MVDKTILTDEEIDELRKSGPPQIKACPHWDDRYRWFRWKGQWWILFCCNRPDLDGGSGSIGDLPRGETCLVYPWISSEELREWARDLPVVAVVTFPSGNRMIPWIRTESIEGDWQAANEWIDENEEVQP